MDCSDLERLLPAYADGEFASADGAEIEIHLANCESCREQVDAQVAFRAFIRLRVPEAVAAPPRLRAEIQRRIAKERASENLRRFGGYSAVAASLVALASVSYLLAEPQKGTQSFELVMDAVDKHARALPVEVTPAAEVDLATWFQGKVDFNVRTPTFRSPSAPRLLGARLANVRDRQAAYFVYGGEQPGKRMTLLVFPGGDLKLPQGKRMQVGEHDVLMANERGYNVALWQNRGILYSLVSDLDEQDVLQLVSQVEAR